jgi:uroporphyrinogen decarboxylase
MDPRALKEKYGGRLCFWGGGCDNAVLPRSRPERVAEHVREMIRIFSPGAGFVFQQVHNIMPETPAENIIALFQAARSSGNPD